MILLQVNEGTDFAIRIEFADGVVCNTIYTRGKLRTANPDRGKIDCRLKMIQLIVKDILVYNQTFSDLLGSRFEPDADVLVKVGNVPIIRGG